MNRKLNIGLTAVAIILIFNGLINIIDNGKILAYDITSIFSGIGFILLIIHKNKVKT